VCPLGSRVTFKWSGTMHDIWQLPSEKAYNTCDFSQTVSSGAAARKVSLALNSASFDFACDKLGIFYFACSVQNACSEGNQKVRIYVSDPVKTVKLRAKGGLSLEEFNRKHTLLFAGYANNNQGISQANADKAITDAESVLKHSPESCSDWIPASWNSDKSCRAFLYTDLGFISRVRPTPDFAASERYYMQALQITPGMCGATSYLAELRVQQGNKAKADKLYVETCTACGQYSMDFFDLNFAYDKRQWTKPLCAGQSRPTTTKASLAGKPVGVSSTTTQPFGLSAFTVSAHYTAKENLPSSITSQKLFAANTYKAAKRSGLAEALNVASTNIVITGFEVNNGTRRLSNRKLATSSIQVKTSFVIQVADATAAKTMTTTISRASSTIRRHTNVAMAAADWSRDSVISVPPTMKTTPTIKVQPAGSTATPASPDKTVDTRTSASGAASGAQLARGIQTALGLGLFLLLTFSASLH